MAKNQIAKLRKEAGLSQPELAKLIGVTPSHLSKMENGKKSVTMTRALRIADVLNVTLNDIFLQ